MLLNVWPRNTCVEPRWVPPTPYSGMLAGRGIFLPYRYRVVRPQVRIREKVAMAQLAEGNKSLISVRGLLQDEEQRLGVE